MTRRATRHAPARVRPTVPGGPSAKRLHVARLAGRIMAEEGVATPAQARAKALDRLGIPAQRDVPDNRQIAAFLCEYQRLFQADSQAQALRIRRAVALRAMSLLTEFEPLVAGPVLDGSAGTQSWVSLHVFADAPEDVGIALLNLAIPYKSGDKKLRRGNGLVVSQPCFRFMADEVPVEIIVFRRAERHEPPLCPVLDRPMARADRRRLAGLLGPEGL